MDCPRFPGVDDALPPAPKGEESAEPATEPKPEQGVRAKLQDLMNKYALPISFAVMLLAGMDLLSTLLYMSTFTHSLLGWPQVTVSSSMIYRRRQASAPRMHRQW